VRAAVRDMLRPGGCKPTGRGKPASEYLVRAASEGQLAPINLAVDACQRTKTGPATVRTLSIVWGCGGHEARLRRAAEWYRELLARVGGQTEAVGLEVASR
jgi:hypothetical protein